MRRAITPLAIVLAALVFGALRGSAQMDPAARASRAAVLIQRADALVARGDVGSAIGFYRDAVSVSPREPRAYASLARAYLTRSSVVDAREVLRVGIRQCLETADLVRLMIDVEVAEGHTEQALENMRSYLLDRPADAEVWAMRSAFAQQLGYLAEALRAERRVRALRTSASQLPAEARRPTPREEALMFLLGSLDPMRGACGQNDIRRSIHGACTDPARVDATSPSLVR